MTTIHGNEGYVSVNSNELKVKSFQLTINAPVTPDTEIGDEWDTNIAGAPKNWRVTLTLSKKTGSAAQNDLVEGTQIAVGLYSAGNGSGQAYHSGNARVETVDQSQDPTNPVGLTVTAVGNGALARATV
ncbi:hypothetical protein [Roseibium aggregatum]|uniref:hypothetical protein n=1 Tax=Roseibium aggregatum TaxID=187304 RepID=UPI001E522C0B|nr:hypothetical protein [Roseibium aggregatum]UES51573.1 hypothetical protein GFK88_19315 [Roseibium aggregatum]